MPQGILCLTCDEVVLSSNQVALIINRLAESTNLIRRRLGLLRYPASNNKSQIKSRRERVHGCFINLVHVVSGT